MTVIQGETFQRLGDVFLVDSQHDGRTGTVGVYLVPIGGGEFVLVETGPGSTLDTVIAGIGDAGFELEALHAILVTHIHLDHAGAAGALVSMTDAEVIVHERGGSHLNNPAKLLASAARIYGEQMNRLWGPMISVPKDRIQTVAGGEILQLGQRQATVIYSPGHASHHVAYLLDDGSLFCGDALGIKLSGFPVTRPALPPPEVDIDLWDITLDKILSCSPKRFLLTHFGQVNDVQQHLKCVKEQNHLWAQEILSGIKAGETELQLQRRVCDLSDRDLTQAGATSTLAAKYHQSSNAAMTVMGLSRYWRKRCPKLGDGGS